MFANLKSCISLPCLFSKNSYSLPPNSDPVAIWRQGRSRAGGAAAIMGPPTGKEEHEGAKIVGIEAEEPSASVRQGRARAYIEAGRDAIGRGGVGLEEAGNSFVSRRERQVKGKEDFIAR